MAASVVSVPSAFWPNESTLRHHIRTLVAILPNAAHQSCKLWRKASACRSQSEPASIPTRRSTVQGTVVAVTPKSIRNIGIICFIWFLYSFVCVGLMVHYINPVDALVAYLVQSVCASKRRGTGREPAGRARLVLSHDEESVGFVSNNGRYADPAKPQG